MAASFQDFVSTLGGAGPVAFGALALAVLAGLWIPVLLQGRRRFREELRSIVRAVEELRSGQGRGHSELMRGSRLAILADAVNRLGIDLHNAWSEAETAAQRWRAVSDATQDTAIITTDTDGDVRSFSAGASQLLGWKQGEILSQPASVLYEENAYKDLLPKLTRSSLRTQGVTTRSTMVRRDGSTFQGEVSVRLLTGSSSQPVGFMMVVRDVTEQIRMENQLRDAEKRYRGLVEGLVEGMVIVKDGRIVYANPAAEALCGSSGQELLGTLWRDRVAVRDVLVMENALAEWVGGVATEQTLRCTLVGSDGGESAEVRIEAGAVEFAGGPAVMLLVQDETAERRIEVELRRNETRLDAVLEATSDGVLVLSNDPSRMVQMSNAAFAEMFGLRIEDILGASEDRLLRLLHESGEAGRGLAEHISRGASKHDPGIIAVEGEPRRELQVTPARLTDRRGEELGRVVACRDITRQRQSERELQEHAERLQLSKVELEQSYRKLNDVTRKLEGRTEELDRLNQELQRLDKLKSDLIGNVSHELQTPLVSIRGYTEMILKERLGPISAEQRKGLSLSLKNIDRLISMIDNLMAFSRTDPILRELNLIRVELQPLIEEVVALLEEKITGKNLQVSVELERDDLAVRADRDTVLQVFLNLLSNAVKFSYRGGSIRISARQVDAGYVSASVRDRGVGIPEEDLGRIFERHYQVQRPSTKQPPGSGIGLAIVRDILRLHGCTIDVRSEEGRGTEFTFTLPLAPMGQAPSIPQSEAEPEPEPVEPRPSKPQAGPPPPPEPPEDEPPQPTSRTLRPRLRIIRRYKSEG